MDKMRRFHFAAMFIAWSAYTRNGARELSFSPVICVRVHFVARIALHQRGSLSGR
jgi:hypothetical protein